MYLIIFNKLVLVNPHIIKNQSMSLKGLFELVFFMLCASYYVTVNVTVYGIRNSFFRVFLGRHRFKSFKI